MFGSELLGRTVLFHPTGDPPGAWACSIEGAAVAELVWSRHEGAVRIEALDEVWRARFSGGRVFGGVIEASNGAPHMLYGGGVYSGLALSRRGAPYELFAASDWRHGSWTGVDDVEGAAVLRAVGHVGSDGVGSEVTLSPEPRHARDLGALLFLWAGLRVFGQGRPLRRLFSARVSARAAERALEGVLRSVGGP